MKREKLFQALDADDAELRELLVPRLRLVAQGYGTDLFVTAVNNPWPELRSGSQVGTDILIRARDIIDRAQQLGVATDGLVAAKVIAFFEPANDLEDHHRFGPIRRARAFLDALGEP